VKLPYHIPRNIPLNPAATGQLLNGRGAVRRTSFRNASLTTEAVFQLFDGSGTNGSLIESFSLAPQESARDFYAHDEYPFYVGLFVNIVSGAFEGGIVVQFIGPGFPSLPAVLAVSLADLEAEAAAAAPPAVP
jgi:hypothetical protein